jgi:lia operon protein LiaG
MKMKSIAGLIILGGIVLMGMLSMKVLPMIEIDQESSFSVAEVDQIQIDMSVTPVHVYQIDAGEDIRFHLYGKAAQEVKLATKSHQNTVDVYIEYPTLFPTPTRLYLDVYLPADYEKDLDIQITTGGVKMDSMTLTDFTLNTTTGGLKVEELVAEEVNVRTTTGGVHFDTLDADQLSVNGSTSGVSCNVCTVGSTQIKTSTGSIKVSEGTGNFDLQASTGSVRLRVPELQENNIRLKTTTGSVTLQIPQDAGLSLYAENTTGSIKADFPLNFIAKHKAEAEIGDGSSNIQINATTGSISVQN